MTPIKYLTYDLEIAEVCKCWPLGRPCFLACTATVLFYRECVPLHLHSGTVKLRLVSLVNLHSNL